MAKMKDDFIKSLQKYNENVKEDVPQKQKDIISAALELFSQKGFSATTTASIAAKANVAEKTLFKYYPTKQDLFVQVFYKAAMDLTGSKFVDILGGDGHMRDRFYKALSMKLEQNKDEENARLFKLFIQEILINEELRKSILGFVVPFWQDGAKNSVDKILAESTNKNLDSTAVNTAMISLLIGYIMARTIFFPDANWDDEKNIGNLADILCYGILGEK